jgi:hypothetical protein
VVLIAALSPNDPNSATRPTGRVNCNLSAMAGRWSALRHFASHHVAKITRDLTIQLLENPALAPLSKIVKHLPNTDKTGMFFNLNLN